MGTLLLQIGEVGQRFEKKKSLDIEDGNLNSVDDVDGVDNPLVNIHDTEEKPSDAFCGWSISFEQFLASILTEQSLVDHFSNKVNLQVFFVFATKPDAQM